MTDKNLPASSTDTAVAIWQLRQRGLSDGDIARSLGLTAEVVRNVVKTEMAAAVATVDQHTRGELLALELSRLDMLQAANWEPAVNGDTRAGELCLKVMDRRAKLMGFDENETASDQTVQTVVVTGTSSDYVNALRSIADRQTSKAEDNGPQ